MEGMTQFTKNPPSAAKAAGNFFAYQSYIYGGTNSKMEDFMDRKKLTISWGLAGAFVLLAARFAGAGGIGGSAGAGRTDFLTAGAQTWDKKYVRSLPDSAFAAVENLADGRKLRLLPHHDASGEIDAAHLRSALRLWRRVKWQDPKDAQAALAHLKAHQAQLCREGRMKCAAGPKLGRKAARKSARTKIKA